MACGAADRRQHVEGVLGVRELGVGHRGGRDLAQGVDEGSGLGHGGQGVVGPVDHEERRSVAVHPVDGGRVSRRQRDRPGSGA